MPTRVENGITFEYPPGVSDVDFAQQYAGKALNALVGKMELFRRVVRISAVDANISFYDSSSVLLLSVAKISLDPIESPSGPVVVLTGTAPVPVVTSPA